MGRAYALLGTKKVIHGGQVIGDNATPVTIFPFDEDLDFRVLFNYKMVSSYTESQASVKSTDDKTVLVDVGVLDARSSYVASTQQILIAEIADEPVYFNFYIKTIGSGVDQIFILSYSIVQGF